MEAAVNPTMQALPAGRNNIRKKLRGGLMATAILDVKGMSCPSPIMQVKKKMFLLEPGDTLEVHATDSGSVRDFESFCKSKGHELLESDEEAGYFRFVIQKG